MFSLLLTRLAGPPVCCEPPGPIRGHDYQNTGEQPKRMTKGVKRMIIQNVARTSGFFVAGLTATLLASATYAAPVSLLATHDPGQPNSFSLSFFGGAMTRQAGISTTDFELLFDTDPNPTGSARFLSYNQSIDSIDMPDPQGGADIPTGALTVEVVPGSSGISSFDPATGIFTTTETYRITYANDLTALGLGGPGSFVEFPSTSTGQIVYETATSGRISQTWQGQYDLGGTIIDYTCEVNTQFTPEPATLALLAFAGLFISRRRTAR